MLEYNLVGASTKPTILKYFRKNLKPSVLAELEYQDLELKSSNQMVKKAVKVKAKMSLWPRSNTKKMDQNCFYGHQLANSTIAKSQGSAIKDSQIEEPKTWSPESLSDPQCSNESSEKAWKKKKV